MNRRRLYIGAMLAAGFIAVVYAHHGWSEFDQSVEKIITGSVIDPRFEYPHAAMELDSEGEVWTVYMAPPRRLNRMGVNADNLAEGDTVSVAGHPHREAERTVRIYRITIGDETLNIR